MSMIGKQIYISEELNTMLNANFGEGKISSNIERILRTHLADPDNEVKMQYQDLKRTEKIFNALYPRWCLSIVLTPREEKTPTPPKEEEEREQHD